LLSSLFPSLLACATITHAGTTAISPLKMAIAAKYVRNILLSASSIQGLGLEQLSLIQIFA
jgi:hypothetical protein